MWTARESFALMRQRIRERWKDAAPRSLLVMLYGLCLPVCAGVWLESYLKQPIASGLATIPFLDVRLWAQMLLVALAALGISVIGAVAGWCISSAVTDLADSNRACGYRALFIAIALPVLLLTAPLCLVPGYRDAMTRVLGFIAAPIVAIALCYCFHLGGWPTTSHGISPPGSRDEFSHTRATINEQPSTHS